MERLSLIKHNYHKIMARTKNGISNKRSSQDPQSNRVHDQLHGVKESMRRSKQTRIDHDNNRTEIENEVENKVENGMENELHEMPEDVCEKRTRGPTYMARVWVRKDRKEVEFNELGQAIGPNKSEYVEFIGTLVRNGKLIPLNIKDWHNVPNSYKSKLLDLVKEKFCGSSNLENHTLTNLARSWRNWKNRVKTKFFDKDLSLEQNLRKRPDLDDERVFIDQWKELVIYWSSDAAQKLSEQNKDIRKTKTMNHITGKRSFAQVRDKMKKELVASENANDSSERMDDEIDVDETSDNDEADDNVEPSRMDLFAKCYTKNGETSNPKIADSLRKMNELVSGLPPGETDIGPNNIFSQVVGEDKGGRVKMYGEGATRSAVYGDALRRGKFSPTYMSQKNEVNTLKQRVDQQEKLIKIQELIKMNKERSRHDSPPEVTKTLSSSSRDHSISCRPSTSSSCMMRLQVGAKVCLKSISEPSKTVAIGNIQSLDSSKKVGEVRLGPRWCEVHINVGVDPDELLIRRISNFKTIGEAIGLTVAWPQSLVTLDS